LQDKVNLYHSISDNRNDVISSIMQVEKKLSQKNSFDNMSICKENHLILVFNNFFTNFKISDDETFKELINRIMDKFYVFINNLGFDFKEKQEIKIKEVMLEKKKKTAWLCPHFSRIHYARGKCRNCYLNNYHKVIRYKSRNILQRRKKLQNSKLSICL
jgi:hypothetical protein